MGTWGTGSFENDEAGDFAIEFESDGLASLSDALDVAEIEYLDAAQAQRAIAAAEILAIAIEGDAAEDAVISPELHDAIQRHGSDIMPRKRGLVRQALSAIERIEADQSELKELWAESDGEEWLEALHDLRSRLRLA